MRNAKRTIRVPARDVIADLAPPPQWIEPELCKLVTRIPAGDNWAHEIKFDGFRMHARIVSGAAALLTRNGLDWTAKYPDVAAAIGALNCRQAYVDGELCAKLPDGVLKKISEAKRLTGENKFKPAFSFVNRAFPILLCNNLPSLAGLSPGM